MRKLKVLIIHPLKVIADLICFKIESDYNCEASIALNLTDARKKNYNSHFRIIISATDISGENSFDFFRDIVESGNLPMFFVIENKIMEYEYSHKGKAPNGIIPETYILQTLSLFLNKALTKSDDTPEEWTKISFLPLVHFAGIPVDVFIQLISGRFLKIFSRNDKITTFDVDRYTGKGVTNLYLKKQSFNWLINEIDEAMPVISKNPGTPIVVLNQEPDREDEEVISGSTIERPFQFEEDQLEAFHQSSKKILSQMKKNPDLAKLLKTIELDRTPNAYIKNRCHLICNISCALARELAWSSDSMFEKLIYVAYTHDLTLVSNPKLASVQTLLELELIPDLSPEDRKLFLNHPKSVAELVLRDSKAPAEAEMIIRQHHELANSKGFPDGLQSVRILPTAALLEISIHFAQYIIENPNWKFDRYVLYASPHFRGGPFTKIFKALENLLKKRA